MATDNRPLTGLLATVRGWPTIRPAVERLVDDVVRAGGDAMILDGSGLPPPGDTELPGLGSTVQWVSMPGKSVFQLRYAGYQTAKGEVVAVTEDHVLVGHDWAQRHLAVHAAHPDAGAVGGAVENGSNARVVDWAAFFMIQGPFIAPLVNGPAKRLAMPANVSYKRRVLRRLGGDETLGLIDWMELPRALEGESLIADDTIRVLHHQSQGFWRTSLAEFDNGRTIAGYRRRRMTGGDWARLITSPLLPVYRSFRAIRLASHKQRPAGTLARSAPALMWFQYCAMAGEVLGYVGGPGSSPNRLY
jgi:hypothetical protein